MFVSLKDWFNKKNASKTLSYKMIMENRQAVEGYEHFSGWDDIQSVEYRLRVRLYEQARVYFNSAVIYIEIKNLSEHGNEGFSNQSACMRV